MEHRKYTSSEQCGCLQGRNEEKSWDADRERRLLEHIEEIGSLGEQALAPNLKQAVELTERLARSLPDLAARFIDMFLGVRGEDH
jgi:hypothetical protein